MRRVAVAILAVCLCSVWAAPALASGFSIYEQSAKASGLAGAWVARSDDPAANWYNPASLTRLEGNQFQFGTNLIFIGQNTDLTSSDPAFGLMMPTKFEPESSVAVPSHFYFTQKVNDRIAWGVGVNTPYGLLTQWKDLPVTLSARKSELTTLVLNPNVAFTVGERWSVAVGVDYIYADVKAFSRDFDQSALLMQPPLTTVGRSNLTGDGNDVGFNVAAHWSGEGMSFGVTYRGSLSPEIEGDVRYTDVNPTLSALFPDGPGKATLDLPAQAAAGFAWGVGEDWDLEVDVAWAEWSRFEELAIDFENETAAVTDITLREDWDNTFSYRVGAAWGFREMQELRFGVVYDESPVPTDTLRPSIPDADRTGLTVGYGWTGERWTIDAYYMALQFKDITANGNPAEGVIDGEYSSFSNLLGATFNIRF